MASTAATDAPMMIFFFRLNAMFSSFDQGLKFLIENEVVVLSGKPFTLEVVSTSKLIKLFHLTPNSERV
jgi:hypothetical protein